MFCVASKVCGCVLCAQCMFCVHCAFACVRVLWFCVCSGCMCAWGDGSGLHVAPAGAQLHGGAKGAQEQPQPRRGPRWGQRYVEEETLGHMRVYRAGMGEVGGTPGGYEAGYEGGWETLRELCGIWESNVTPKGSGYWGRELGPPPGDQGDPGGGGYGAPRGVVEHTRRGSLWGTGEVRGTLGGLWDTQEVGKTQGFMRHTRGPGPPWTVLGAPKGAQGHPERGRIAGAPQKLMPEPRPVAPPLLQTSDRAPRGRKDPRSPPMSSLTGGAHGCQRGARAAHPGRRPARGGGAPGPGKRKGGGCHPPAGGRL